MKNMQHLLEKKDELRKEFYDLEIGIDRKDIADWWLKKISTIQQEIISEFKKKVEESKLLEVATSPLALQYKKALNRHLSDLSSWLEGNTK